MRGNFQISITPNYIFPKEVTSMWGKLSLVATIGSIIFGLLGTVCDCKDAASKITTLKKD